MATTVEALLNGPEGHALKARVLPVSARQVTQVTLLEDFTLTDALRPGAAVVLSRATGIPASGYQLDVLVRQAAAREVAVLVIRRSSRRSPTAESLAGRGRVALVDVADDADPLQVMDRLAAAVSGDSRTALARLAAAAAFEPAQTADTASMLAELARLSGVPLALLGENDAGPPVEIDGRYEGCIASPDTGDAATVAARLAASVLSRVLTDRERFAMKPLRSTSSALSQLLLCSQANLAAVAERAVDVGLQAHGWHCAVRLLVDTNDGNDDEAGLSQIEDDLVSDLANRPRDPRSSWTVARPDSSLVLVRTTRSDPGRDSDGLVRSGVEELLGGLIERHPTARFRAGLATPHEGPSGLRASAEEARIALASAKLSADVMSLATFDSLGLRRMLAEWLVTNTARDTVRDLLEPLDALGPEKAAVAIETLHAYLDERGSLQRAAARLNIHRNAVVYRMAQISVALPNDLNDPDQRFALQLACRARLMTTTRT